MHAFLFSINLNLKSHDKNTTMNDVLTCMLPRYLDFRTYHRFACAVRIPARVAHECRLAFRRVCTTVAGNITCHATKLPNGLFDGVWEKHKNGQLIERHMYASNMLEGVVERWHANGRLESHLTYVNNMLEGVCELWHDNGQLGGRCTYVAGRLDGIFGTMAQ